MSDYFLPDVQSCPSLCVETTPGTTPASMEGTALRESCPVTVHLDSLDTGRTGDLVYQYWTLVLDKGLEPKYISYIYTYTHICTCTIYYPYFYYFLSIQLSQIKWRFLRFKEIRLGRGYLSIKWQRLGEQCHLKPSLSESFCRNSEQNWQPPPSKSQQLQPPWHACLRLTCWFLTGVSRRWMSASPIPVWTEATVATSSTSLSACARWASPENSAKRT